MLMCLFFVNDVFIMLTVCSVYVDNVSFYVDDAYNSC